MKNLLSEFSNACREAYAGAMSVLVPTTALCVAGTVTTLGMIGLRVAAQGGIEHLVDRYAAPRHLVVHGDVIDRDRALLLGTKGYLDRIAVRADDGTVHRFTDAACITEGKWLDNTIAHRVEEGRAYYFAIKRSPVLGDVLIGATERIGDR